MDRGRRSMVRLLLQFWVDQLHRRLSGLLSATSTEELQPVDHSVDSVNRTLHDVLLLATIRHSFRSIWS